jgi:hypothetical protein
VPILDVNVGLGILAFLAKNKFVDEPVEVVLKLRGFVSPVDDPTVISRISICLGS